MNEINLIQMIYNELGKKSNKKISQKEIFNKINKNITRYKEEIKEQYNEKELLKLISLIFENQRGTSITKVKETIEKYYEEFLNKIIEKKSLRNFLDSLENLYNDLYDDENSSLSYYINENNEEFLDEVLNLSALYLNDEDYKKIKIYYIDVIYINEKNNTMTNKNYLSSTLKIDDENFEEEYFDSRGFFNKKEESMINYNYDNIFSFNYDYLEEYSDKYTDYKFVLTESEYNKSLNKRNKDRKIINFINNDYIFSKFIGRDINKDINNFIKEKIKIKEENKIKEKTKIKIKEKEEIKYSEEDNELYF